MSGDGQKITVYYSSISGNINTVKSQNQVELILKGLKVDYEKLDVTVDGNLATMRELMGDANGRAPQIFKGDIYLGTCEELEEANENGNTYDFLHLPRPQRQAPQ